MKGYVTIHYLDGTAEEVYVNSLDETNEEVYNVSDDATNEDVLLQSFPELRKQINHLDSNWRERRFHK